MDASNVGDEGGFAPNILENDEALELLKMATQGAGHPYKVVIMHVVVCMWRHLSYIAMRSSLDIVPLGGVDIQIVGDDLTVTNPKRIAQAIGKRVCNCLLLKVNHIGSTTKSVQAPRLVFPDAQSVLPNTTSSSG
ncbi:hypothetical protein HJG60_007962 [Phyllostomus discolor]|uniref:phosphopyruvate hydratase n=1 Tax=Phyllostomus discolor TaxID=89673 RepID=A0A834EVQ4_9CHIR|nr:hypothetical protein HJG60_007962 [Phyllostomus discolor]